MLLFGDGEGHITISDRTFQADRRHKAFRGAVCGLSYIFDSMNPRRQYVVAVGDDARPMTEDKSEDHAMASAYYVIKVAVIQIKAVNLIFHSFTSDIVDFRCLQLRTCRALFKLSQHQSMYRLEQF